MTLAEIVFLVAGTIGIYFLLRPLERWLEVAFRRTLSGRRPGFSRNIIDVTDFTSRPSWKEDHEHRP